jgi:hypothetical protein
VPTVTVLAQAYQQSPQAVGGSLWWSALISVLPLAVVLVLLGVLRHDALAAEPHDRLRRGEAGGSEGRAAAQGDRRSLATLVVLATLIFLQSTPVLGWMLP